MRSRDRQTRRARALFVVVTVGAALTLAGAAQARPGDLDRSFGVDGTVLRKALSGADQMATDGRGRTVVLSDRAFQTRLTHLVVTRFLTSGRLDKGFGRDGSVRIDAGGRQDYAEGLALTDRGRIVIAADTGTSNRYDACDGGESYTAEVFRLRPRGELDRSFGAGGSRSIRFQGGGGSTASSSPTSLAVSADGSIVLSGYAFVDRPSGCEQEGVAVRLTPGGDLDPAFGDDGVTFLGRAYQAIDVETSSDGSALLAVNLSDGIGVAKLTATGELEDSFGTEGIGRADGTFVRDLAVLSSGRIIVSGGFTERRAGLVAFDADGSVDPGYGEAGVVDLPFIYAYALPLIAQGESLLAAGPLGELRPRRTHDFGLARIGPDGMLDDGFADDGVTRIDVSGGREDDPVSLAWSAGSTVTLGGAVAREAGDAMALVRFRLR